MTGVYTEVYNDDGKLTTTRESRDLQIAHLRESQVNPITQI
jgi:hypothetical protein